MGVLARWTVVELVTGSLVVADTSEPRTLARCATVEEAEMIANALNDLPGAVEAERERIRAVLDEALATRSDVSLSAVSWLRKALLDPDGGR